MDQLQDLNNFAALEKKLSYEDIRFYRSIARSRLRKDIALRKKLETEKKKPQTQTWTSWLWGSSKDSAPADPAFGGSMTDEQRKQLYDVLDFNEKSILAESLQAPRDSLKARVAAKLNKGSFTLKTDPHGTPEGIISVVFDVFQANVLQRPDNFEASVSLGGFGVFDGTTKNTLYPQIVQVKDPSLDSHNSKSQILEGKAAQNQNDPFLFVKYENKPLDERADNALTVRMRHMEIIYHKGYVEAVHKFFKPPSSQLESVEALLVRNVTCCWLEFNEWAG
jgi:vacuolar protein sorting-associated protein 13A/C